MFGLQTGLKAWDMTVRMYVCTVWRVFRYRRINRPVMPWTAFVILHRHLLFLPFLNRFFFIQILFR